MRLKTDHKISILIVAFIVSTIFIIGIPYREANLSAPFDADDSFHSSAANSFREGKNFELNFTPKSAGVSVDEFITTFPDNISQPYPRGLTYYVLLGSFYFLLQTTPPNFLLHGFIFSNILSSVFLVLCFFLIKKYFDLKIAFFSSIAILFNPIFVLVSQRIDLYFPSLIFVTAALFFLKRTNHHYIIFGILVGVSHLTHQAAIIVGTGYLLFLLLNREFKGAVIVFLAWTAVLIPRFLWNYYFWKDIGVGLYLPFSSRISEFLGFLPSKTIDKIEIGIFSSEKITEFSTSLSIYLFEDKMRELLELNIDYLILLSFFIIFAFFCFTNFPKKIFFKKKNTKILFYNINYCTS